MIDRPRATVESFDATGDTVTAQVQTPVRDEPVTVRALGSGRYLVEIGTRRLTVSLARGPLADWGHVDGHTLRWPLASESDEGADRALDPDALAASTPATVTAVRVAVGDEVATGDTLVVLEAMKMEMPIRAPRPGRVLSLRCATGDQVQPGVPLVELEELRG